MKKNKMKSLKNESRTNARHGKRKVSTVEYVSSAKLPLFLGEFKVTGFRSLTSSEEFIALQKGDISSDEPILVRIHSQCLTGDVFGSMRCDCGEQLKVSLRKIEEEQKGVIIYQMQEGRGIGILNKIRAYSLQDVGYDTVEANEMLGLEIDARKYEQCVEILHLLGIKKVYLITNNPMKIRALDEGGFDLVERVSVEVQTFKPAEFYLQTKKLKLGHLLESLNSP